MMSMLQGVLSVVCGVVSVLAVMTCLFIAWGLASSVLVLLMDCILNVVLCVLEHILPDNRVTRKDKYFHRIPEAPPPPPSVDDRRLKHVATKEPEP